MSDTQEFRHWIEDRGGKATLGEILNTHFAAEYRKHASLLRREGYTIECVMNHKEPSKNLYILTPPQESRKEVKAPGMPVNVAFYKAEGGQGYLMDILG